MVGQWGVGWGGSGGGGGGWEDRSGAGKYAGCWWGILGKVVLWM